MSKIAAIAPIIGAIGGGGAAATAATVGGLGLAAYGAHKRNKELKALRREQEAATKDWLEMQRRTADRYRQREESNRGEAIGQLTDYLRTVTPEKRMDDINTRTAEMAKRFMPAQPDTPDAMLFASDGNDAATLRTDAARELAKATAESRKRIEALARVGAFGGHFARDALAANAVSRGIFGVNDRRAGDLRSLRRYQGVTPEIFEPENDGLADAALGVGGLLAGRGIAGLWPGGTS